MSYQDMKKHGRYLKAYYEVKKANLKRLILYDMIPAMWESGKGKIIA